MGELFMERDLSSFDLKILIQENETEFNEDILRKIIEKIKINNDNILDEIIKNSSNSDLIDLYKYINKLLIPFDREKKIEKIKNKK